MKLFCINMFHLFIMRVNKEFVFLRSPMKIPGLSNNTTAFVLSIMTAVSKHLCGIRQNQPRRVEEGLSPCGIVWIRLACGYT